MKAWIIPLCCQVTSIGAVAATMFFYSWIEGRAYNSGSSRLLCAGFGSCHSNHSDSTLAIRAKTRAMCQNLNFGTSPWFWECNMIYGWEEVSGLLPLQRFCRLLQCRCLPGAERCGVARVWLCARPYVRRVCMPKIGILLRLL